MSAEQLLESGAVDDRAADFNAGGTHFFGRLCADVDVELGQGVDAELLLGRGGVVGLDAECAVDPARAVLPADLHRRRGQDFLRDAAETVDTDIAVVVNAADDKAERIHVGKGHHMVGVGFCAGECGDAVADAVDDDIVGVFEKVVSHFVGHRRLVARRGGCEHQIAQYAGQFTGVHRGPPQKRLGSKSRSNVQSISVISSPTWTISPMSVISTGVWV